MYLKICNNKKATFEHFSERKVTSRSALAAVNTL